MAVADREIAAAAGKMAIALREMPDTRKFNHWSSGQEFGAICWFLRHDTCIVKNNSLAIDAACVKEGLVNFIESSF
jgi:hypothetical protein